MEKKAFSHKKALGMAFAAFCVFLITAVAFGQCLKNQEKTETLSTLTTIEGWENAGGKIHTEMNVMVHCGDYGFESSGAVEVLAPIRVQFDRNVVDRAEVLAWIDATHFEVCP